MKIVLDWNKRNSRSMKKYIRVYIENGVERICYSDPEYVVTEGVMFRNFPYLEIGDNQMINCCFENCGKIILNTDEKRYGHGGCLFRNIQSLVCSGQFLKTCIFENIECTDSTFVNLLECRMSGCTFKNVILRGETYLVRGYGGNSCVHGCELINVVSERNDGELFQDHAENRSSWWEFTKWIRRD